MTNGSHTVVVGPGMLSALVDGSPFPMGARSSYSDGQLLVPSSLATHLSRLNWRATSTRYGYSRQTQVGQIALRRVVIDAGHGGHDPGAIGPRRYKEKTINLQVANDLARLLRARSVQVVMTRTSDRFVPLSQRAHIANTAGADVFVSIHANATRSRWTSGVETFTQSTRVSDYARAKRAASRYDGRAFGLSYRTASSERSAFVKSLRRGRYLSKSLGTAIQRRLVSASGENNRGLKSQNFCVLRECYIPAVLVEVGFISNAKTEIRFRSPAYRRTLAAAIANGLADYSRHHPSRYSNYASAPRRSDTSTKAVSALPVSGRSNLVSYLGR